MARGLEVIPCMSDTNLLASQSITPAPHEQDVPHSTEHQHMAARVAGYPKCTSHLDAFPNHAYITEHDQG